MADKQLPWYEFFAGGGMARLGLGARWHCVFANDWCEKKAAAYRAYFGPSPELVVRDVRQVKVAELPGTANLAWASFPCQDLSLAGNYAGLKGERSGTFAPFWELIRGLARQRRKPRMIVLENVTGAITSHQGQDFTTLIRTVSETGYWVGALVIDAIHFLPQSRPRLFIVAVENDFPLPGDLVCEEPTSLWHSAALVRAFRNLPRSLKDAWVWWNLPEPQGRVPTLSSLIEENPTGTTWHPPEVTERLIGMMSEVNRAKLKKAQRERTLRVGTIYKRTRPIAPNHAVRVQRAEVRFDDVSGCLRTPVGGSSRQTILIVEGKKIRSRLLSPREAARLMGVPDAYPVPNNYNEGYHVFGDGVAVPVVAWLERHLLYPLTARPSVERSVGSHQAQFQLRA